MKIKKGVDAYKMPPYSDAVSAFLTIKGGPTYRLFFVPMSEMGLRRKKVDRERGRPVAAAFDDTHVYLDPPPSTDGELEVNYYPPIATA